MFDRILTTSLQVGYSSFGAALLFSYCKVVRYSTCAFSTWSVLNCTDRLYNELHGIRVRYCGRRFSFPDTTELFDAACLFLVQLANELSYHCLYIIPLHRNACFPRSQSVFGRWTLSLWLRWWSPNNKKSAKAEGQVCFQHTIFAAWSGSDCTDK